MQERHLNRYKYFNELSNTARDYYVDYLRKFVPVEAGVTILEVGCGEGGNLLPFAEVGCNVTGIDRSETRIMQAKKFFSQSGQKGNFIADDFFNVDMSAHKRKYDVILIHDVIEHISEKELFIKHLRFFLAENGVIFWGFPAWQMPFGGHQQICRNKVCSMLPFIHLLPEKLYAAVLKAFGESKPRINELIDIKNCGVTVEYFEKLLEKNNYGILDRTLWLINPHYKQKFKLIPRKLCKLLSRMRYIRNFFSTSCFYIAKYD